MKLIPTPNNHIHYDADEQTFIVWNDDHSAEIARTPSFDEACVELEASDLSLPLPAPDASYKSAWRSICEALDKHHPEWIDGNGPAIEKVITWISNKR